MQTENSHSEGKWIMPETRFTEFPAFSVDPRVGISRSAPETEVRLSFLPMTLELLNIIRHFFHYDILTSHKDLLRTSFGVSVVAHE